VFHEYLQHGICDSSIGNRLGNWGACCSFFLQPLAKNVQMKWKKKEMEKKIQCEFLGKANFAKVYLEWRAL